MRSEQWLSDCVFIVENFLSLSECDQYIRISEAIGFEDALVTSPAGSIRVKNLRNNERVIFKSNEIADWLWERAIDFVPMECEGRAAIGVNELLRFYRYDPGQQFDWHQDFAFEGDQGEKSYWTFLIYLNDDFQGGATSFDDSCSDEPFDEFSVTPKTGMALFFEHPTWHKGEMVVEGRKYVMRTDVMFGPQEDENLQYDDFDEFD